MKKLLVANWKMQKTFNESIDFAHNHASALKNIMQKSQHEIVICPTFPTLFTLANALKDTRIKVGAQTVSRHASGAYTGQVAAQTLAEAGCTFCIIGHSETRKYQHESNVDIEHKCKELLKNNITPIICIGESKEALEQGRTFEILHDQLSLILQAIAEFNHDVERFVIAYEPTWAIGTGSIPKTDDLTKIFAWLHEQCAQKTKTSFSLLYGGSVNQQNAADTLNITHVDGLLIGGASLHFDSFCAIIDAHIGWEE